jgi:hypothetical protein
MSKKTIIVLIVIGAFIVMTLGSVGIGFLMYVSIKNKHAEIHNQASAQQKANEVIYDEVWKVLQQKAGILDKFSSDFKSIYSSIFDERYQGENSGQSPAFKWIQEQNPNFTPEMYKDLSTAVEVYRGKFSRTQQKLIDIKREDDNMHTKIPSLWFVGSKKDLDINIVTSTKTEKVFQTGKEDDIDLFKK